MTFGFDLFLYWVFHSWPFFLSYGTIVGCSAAWKVDDDTANLALNDPVLQDMLSLTVCRS